MKKQLAILVLPFLVCSTAHAQNTSSATDATADSVGGMNNKRQHARFDKVKANALAKIEKRIKFLNDIKLCLEDSQTLDELKECKPERPESPDK